MTDTQDQPSIDAILGSARLQADLSAYIDANPLPQPVPDRYTPPRTDFAVVAATMQKTIDFNLPGDYVAAEGDCELEEFAEHLLNEHVEAGGLYASGLYVVDATACPEFIECLSGKAYRCGGSLDLCVRMNQLLVALPAATDGRVLAVYYCKVIG